MRAFWVSFNTVTSEGDEVSVEARLHGPGDDIQCSEVHIFPPELQDEYEDELADEAIRRFQDGEL